MENVNEMRLDMRALPENEAFARLAVSGFLLPLDPTIEELSDVKTAVSEAVTNAIIHGYGGGTGIVRLRATYSEDGEVHIEVIDHGRGIRDIAQARQPFFSTSPDEARSGMGFTVMESFMDEVQVESAEARGTTVRLIKRLQPREEALPRRA